MLMLIVPRLIRLGIALSLYLIIYLINSEAHAAVSIDKGDNKTVFVSKDGKILTPLEANHKAENGDTVLACKVQDYVCNERTGKCAMKNAK